MFLFLPNEPSFLRFGNGAGGVRARAFGPTIIYPDLVYF